MRLADLGWDEAFASAFEALSPGGGGTAIGESIFQSINEVARLAADAGGEGPDGGDPVPARS